jgi:hypothetical protein
VLVGDDEGDEVGDGGGAELLGACVGLGRLVGVVAVGVGCGVKVGDGGGV